MDGLGTVWGGCYTTINIKAKQNIKRGLLIILTRVSFMLVGLI